MAVIKKLPNLVRAELESKNNISQLKLLISNYLKTGKKEAVDKIKEEQRVKFEP
jgi:hypothetical protein